MFSKNQIVTTNSIILIYLFSSVHSFGLPQGGVVVDGQATIESNSNYMQINQSSNSAIVNWQSFNIGAGEHTHFQQPSSSAITINRVNAANGNSAIFGKLTATGQIFLLNPSGILFGSTAEVNVGSILASTSDINMQAYSQGLIELMPNQLYQGSIINHGNIHVRDGGYAAFVAPNVVNHGIIKANLGHVQLTSGEFFTVDLFGDGLINLKVPENKINGKYTIDHNGQIYADGGAILITAADANDIVSSVINMDGLLQANSIADNNGKIILSANKSGTLNFESNNKIYAAGGQVKASGKDIHLASNSIIDVSSNNDNTKAGEVFIGGNYQGTLLSENDFNAQNVIMDPNAFILANGSLNGDGGKIVLWSDNNAQVAGQLHAKSGLNSGNGGLIETSGKYNLDIKSTIDINTASLNNSGTNGTWLLDPIILVVNNSLAASINTALLTNNVTITTNDGQPPIQNASDNSMLAGGTVINDPSIYLPNLDAGDIVFLNVIGNANDTPIEWSTTNKLSIIAADDIHFGLPDSNGVVGSRQLITDTVIRSTGGGDIHLQTNSDGSLPIIGNHSSFGSFYDYFYQNGNNPTFLPIANAVVSTGGGLVELYSDHNPINSGGPASALEQTDVEVINGLGHNYNGFVNVSGGSQLIDYQLVYEQVPGRTLHDINPAIFLAPIINDKSFALNQNINTLNFPGIGGTMLSRPFTGSFDGLGHTISNLNVVNTNVNSGFFNETNSTNVANKYNGGSQYFKNITFNNAAANATTNNLTPVSAGILIGHASIFNNSSIDISNILIQQGQVSATQTITNNHGIFGKAGGLIGSTLSLNGTTNNVINLNNIKLINTDVNSSYIAGGMIGEAHAAFINLYGNIEINNSDITAKLNNPIANDNINGLASSFAGGLIGTTINNNFTEINANNSNIIFELLQVNAINQIIDQNAYAGGLIAHFTGKELVFNNITIKESNINALISRADSVSTLNNTFGNSVFAGGLIGSNNINNNTNLTANGYIDILSDINAKIDVTDEQGQYLAYAGGLYGAGYFNQISYNGDINISTLNSSIQAEIETNQANNYSAAVAGGLAGQEAYENAVYNNITINGSIVASNNQIAPSLGLYAGSMAGGLSGQTSATNTIFNGTDILINDQTGTGITASSHGAEAVAYAGGLYGGLNGTTGLSETQIHSNIEINSPVNASTFGSSIDTTVFSEKNIASGGIIGFVVGNNISIESIININSPVTASSEHAPLHAAIQTSGGLFGGLLDSDFTFDTTLFDFHNTAIVNNNNHSATGFTGEVIGYLNVNELHPANGITYGEIFKDVPNDGANWNNGAGDFHYIGAGSPCQGPSAGLCIAATSTNTPPNNPHNPNNPTEVFNQLPEHVTHTITTHTSTTSHAHEGETHSHAPHVPHNDHRSHHNEESEFTASFSNADYKDLIITIGYPGSMFTISNNNLFFIPFTFQGHHGFGMYHKDNHGDFSRPNIGGGEEHH